MTDPTVPPDVGALLDEAAKVNDAATPGTWRVEAEEPDSMTLVDASGDRILGVTLWLDDACADMNPVRSANARRIARFDPPTVRALLACAALHLLVNGQQGIRDADLWHADPQRTADAALRDLTTVLRDG